MKIQNLYQPQKTTSLRSQNNNRAVTQNHTQYNDIGAYFKTAAPSFQGISLAHRIKRIEQLTGLSRNPSERLNFCTKTTIKDTQNNVKEVLVFATKNPELKTKNAPVRIALFDEKANEIGYISFYLNCKGPNLRELEGRHHGTVNNPIAQNDKKYIYVENVDNYYNRGDFPNEEASGRIYNQRMKNPELYYKGVGTRLYELMGGYLADHKLDDNIGLNCYAKLESGSKDFHKKLGFEEYDMKTYVEKSRYNDEDFVFQGMTLSGEKFQELKKKGFELLDKTIENP